MLSDCTNRPVHRGVNRVSNHPPKFLKTYYIVQQTNNASTRVVCHSIKKTHRSVILGNGASTTAESFITSSPSKINQS